MVFKLSGLSGGFDREANPKKWRGEEDPAEDLIGGGSGARIEAVVRGERQLAPGERSQYLEKELKTSMVELCDQVQDAANAFEFEFNGSTETSIYLPKQGSAVFAGDIGAIVGPSGTGKTSALQHLLRSRGAGTNPAAGTSSAANCSSTPVLVALDQHWPPSKQDGGSSTVQSAILACCPAGLPAILACLPGSLLARNYWSLSSSERHRADVAFLIATGEKTAEKNDTIVLIDEFTSTMDRRTAQGLCAAVRHRVRTFGSGTGSRAGFQH